MSLSIQEAAVLVKGHVVGDPTAIIHGITNIEAPGSGLITFAQDEKSLKALENSDISCVIVPQTIQSSTKNIIQSAHPKMAWAKLLGYFFPPETYSRQISPLAVIDPSVKLGSGVTIEAYAVLSQGCEIGDKAVIRSHTWVGKNVKIGNSSVLHPSVVVYDKCEIGQGVIIHAGSVIGADGFGYVATREGQTKIPQVGNVILEAHVEIGALVTIDRATIGSTIIKTGAKIDNQVQIAHNVVIGAHTAISAQTGVSGSSKIGAHVTMGGKVGVGDHVEIGDWTMVGAGAGIPTGKKIPSKQIVFGQPARPYQEARKQIAAQLRAAEMLDEIRELRKRVEELEKNIPAS